MNGAAPNDREAICAALSRVANRIYQKQDKDYSSDVLDVFAWNIRNEETEHLNIIDVWSCPRTSAPGHAL